MSTLRRMMLRAEKTDPAYNFELDDGSRVDPRVVPIPVTLDQRRETLRNMLNHRVTIQAEIARMQEELTNIEQQIHKHQVEFSKEMLLLDIPAPMASEELPPKLPEGDME